MCTIFVQYSTLKQCFQNKYSSIIQAIISLAQDLNLNIKKKLIYNI